VSLATLFKLLFKSENVSILSLINSEFFLFYFESACVDRLWAYKFNKENFYISWQTLYTASGSF